MRTPLLFAHGQAPAQMERQRRAPAPGPPPPAHFSVLFYEQQAQVQTLPFASRSLFSSSLLRSAQEHKTRRPVNHRPLRPPPSPPLSTTSPMTDDTLRRHLAKCYIFARVLVLAPAHPAPPSGPRLHRILTEFSTARRPYLSNGPPPPMLIIRDDPRSEQSRSALAVSTNADEPRSKSSESLLFVLLGGIL